MPEADRLEFALNHLKPTEWKHFEKLCGAFLSEDFPDLRTVAGIGDKGRDAVFQSAGMSGVVVQYSIAVDWASKIVATVDRLAEAKIPCSTLIYVTNQAIGTKGDSVGSKLLARGVGLDIRDSQFFVDRVNHSTGKRLAAEELSRNVVDPLLPPSEVIRNSNIADNELRAGLVYLELQLHDSSAARNLTKLSYDALVLGSLSDTDPTSMRTRDEVVASVARHLPGHPNDQVKASVNGSLQRLKSRHKVVYTGASDSFALHHQERTKQAERATEILAERAEVKDELDALARECAKDLEISFPAGGSRAFTDTADNLLQVALERRGSEFAEAVRREQGNLPRSKLLPIAEDTVTRHLAKLRSLRLKNEELVELALEVAGRVFGSPSSALQAYLRALADAYTHLAFMRETPDVQKAVGHFFSRGDLILDTTVLLPCVAETLLPEDQRQFTNLLRGATDAGMSLHATEGVANEIDTHLQRCLAYVRSDSEWEGETPMVYEYWRTSGGRGDFNGFVSQFRGKAGADDIQLFLDQALNVSRIDLTAVQGGGLSDEERYSFTELWRPRRRVPRGRTGSEGDILLRNDVEMYLGVIGRRRSETRDVFGYESWWVTQDRSAFRMFSAAKAEKIPLRSNPCMSPAFLSNLLSIGPSRERITGTARLHLPVVLDLQQRGLGSRELSRVADEIREKHAGEPEWQVRRRIREAVNELKAQRHDLADTGEQDAVPSTRAAAPG